MKWSAVDFKNKQLNIRNNLLYAKDLGVYQDTTKTDKSTRNVLIPDETIALLKQYREWWKQLRKKSGSKWASFVELPDGSGEKKSEVNEFLFVQEGENLGYPMHPDSPTGYLNEFSKRNNLPHINPHAFRHTLASVLCLNGVDIATISRWLGHGNISTTMNIYEHVLEKGKEQALDCISSKILGDKEKKRSYLYKISSVLCYII